MKIVLTLCWWLHDELVSTVFSGAVFSDRGVVMTLGVPQINPQPKLFPLWLLMQGKPEVNYHPEQTAADK